MTTSGFRFSFRSDSKICDGRDLLRLLGLSPATQRVLVVNPHDDDAILASSLCILALRAYDIPIEVAVTTDGRQGYCDLKQRDKIVRIRKQETIAAYGLLGIPKKQIHFLGFPCSHMLPDQGRRLVRGRQRRSPLAIAGAIGIQNSFTALLRKVRPTILIVPHGDDYHPDHKTTYTELLISIFHSMGDIWPELGPKLTETPALWESLVYCKYKDEPPNLRIEALDTAKFDLKMDAVRCFQSQPQIEPLIERLRAGSMSEVLRIRTFDFYEPGCYDSLFTTETTKRKNRKV